VTAATYAGTVTLQSASSVGGTGQLTLSNTLSGGFGLTKVGSDTVVLTGSSNGSTTTTISAGTLQLGNGGTSGTLGSGAVTNNGTLVFDRTDAYGGTVSNPISGSGGVTLSQGTLTWGGANTYTGVTTINLGTLQLGAAGALGDGTSNTSGVTVASGGALDLAGFTPAATVGLTLNGAGVGGSGVLTNSSVTAATYAGTVTLQSASSVGGTGQLTLSNTLSGGFGLTKVGSDTGY